VPEQDPRLRAALADADRATADAVASLRKMTESIKKDHAAFRRERDRRRDERAQAAREGELGREVQRLQMRVDRHQTTWEDVVEGRDTDPAAAVVRADAHRHLADLARSLHADPEHLAREQELRRAAEETRAEREA
jgi:hypothetical protein